MKSQLQAAMKSQLQAAIKSQFVEFKSSVAVVAENMKVSGNEALKHGARGAHDAIAFYGKAIACKSSITTNVSTYYGNRAQANL